MSSPSSRTGNYLSKLRGKSKNKQKGKKGRRALWKSDGRFHFFPLRKRGKKGGKRFFKWLDY